MKIDLHTHILPRDWPDLDAKYGYSGFVRLDHYKPCCARMMIGDRVFREITDNVWDPKRRIEECDREKISMQVLSTVPVMFSYWAKPADALDLARRLNDHIAEVVRDLFRSDTQPEQSYSERQLYESALDRMAREVAAIEQIDRDAAIGILNKSLQKAA